MAQIHVKHLLIGGGVASLSAARAIRATDAAGSVLMVTQEAVRPYHRGQLTTRLARRGTPGDEFFAVAPEWFADNRVELRTGVRAVRVDAIRMAVSLDNGDEVWFDRLLLATGAVPMTLNLDGAALPNVFHLRTLADADRVHNAIEQTLLARRAPGGYLDRSERIVPRPVAVVVGGGLYGVEVAAGLAARGLEVHIVESTGHLWPRFAGGVTAQSLGHAIEREENASVHLNVHPLHFEGDGRVQRVVLSDGNIIACDLVLVAAGSMVPREILRGTPIACERAILVDKHCQTNIPNIFAAGDCSAILDPLFGKHRWIDYGEHAAVTGRIAGANMAADVYPPPVSYDAVNHFTSKAFGVTLRGWGEARFVARRVHRTSIGPDGHGLIEFGIDADGRVAQVLTLDVDHDPSNLERLVATRRDISGIEEQLRDPAVRIDSLV